MVSKLSKKIFKLMKNFKPAPYPEVKQILDKATRKTLKKLDR